MVDQVVRVRGSVSVKTVLHPFPLCPFLLLLPFRGFVVNMVHSYLLPLLYQIPSNQKHLGNRRCDIRPRAPDQALLPGGEEGERRGVRFVCEGTCFVEGSCEGWVVVRPEDLTRTLHYILLG